VSTIDGRSATLDLDQPFTVAVARALAVKQWDVPNAFVAFVAGEEDSLRDDHTFDDPDVRAVQLFLVPKPRGFPKLEPGPALALPPELFQEERHYLNKALLVGEAGVGKTSIHRCCNEEPFTPTYITTIGVDFNQRTHNLDGWIVKNQFWDTAGQERFRVLPRSYFRAAFIIFVVYDVTDASTFEQVPKWLEEIKVHCPDPPLITLVGNKCDLLHGMLDEGADLSNTVSVEQGEAFAADRGFPFVCTSAKTGMNIKEMMDTELRRSVLKRQATDPTFMQPKPKPEAPAGRSCHTCVLM
jgi:small GTP-binding protein